MIQFIAEEVILPEIPKQKIINWVKETASLYNKKTGDIAYIFCNDKRILEINNQYLQHDYYTDIITFDYSDEKQISGDIFISIDTVKSNSEKFNVLFQKELLRVLIHGILHLCGQEDKTPEEKKIMREKENLALACFDQI